jgi:signal transduction histidine kinase
MAPEPHAIRFDTNQLFRNVPPDALASVNTIPEMVEVGAEEIIFDEGGPGDALYLVASGSVRISTRGRGGRQETLSHVQAGEFFGETALLDPGLRSARAAAAERTVLGRLEMEQWARVLALAPTEITANLMQTAACRLRNATTLFVRELMEAERLSLIGTMAGTIIHDLKNPMNVVMGAAQLLAERRDDPQLVKLSGQLQRSADRVLMMLQELLEYARGTSDLTLTTVVVDDLLHELDDQILYGLPGVGIQVERQIAYRGSLRLDREKFVRVLLNLIKNSVEAMPGGGRLSIEVDADEDQAVFAVVDTGGGIPKNILPTIFEPFVTHGKSQGTGLGMAIAKSIVEAHRGTIAVASTGPDGTRFELRIPLSTSA